MYAIEIYNSDILPCVYLFQEAKDDSGCIVCPLCEKGFQTQHQLTMHIRQVTCTHLFSVMQVNKHGILKNLAYNVN